MTIWYLLERNIKWRFNNRFTIIITILQPLLWLLLYSSVAGQTMGEIDSVNYTAYILPGLMVLISFGTCSSTGIMNYLMKNEGSFYRILIAPIRRSSIVMGQIFEAVLCSFLEITIMLMISLMLSVRIRSGVAGIVMIILLLFLTNIFIAGLTYTISLVLPNEIIYETVMNAIVLPIFFLSSALFPVDQLKGFIGLLVHINPFTQLIQILRNLLFHDSVNWQALSSVTFLMFGLAVLSSMIAIWKLNQISKE